MKKNIHPKLHEAKIISACGAEYTLLSTVKEMKTELCSQSHPFYTGKRRIVDTTGRVERFKQRQIKAEAVKASK